MGEFLAHLEAGDAEPAGGLGLVALGEADGLGVKLRLEVGDHFREGVLFFAALDAGEQVGDVGGVGLAREGWRLARPGKHLLDVLDGDGEGPGDQQGLAHDVFQLADVAGPGLLLKPVDGVGLDGRGLDPQIRGVALHEEFHQVGDVLGSLAQRGHAEDHDAEAIEEVLAELLFADGGFQVAMGGGQHAHVHADRLVAAEALDAFLLKHAQELGLGAGGEVADFVEEDGAALGLLEAANASRLGAGEGAALVAEEFAFEQSLREWRRN